MATFRNVILKKEDFPKLAKQFGGEFDLLMNSLNSMFTQLHTMLAAGLTFNDNIISNIRTVQVVPKQQYPLNVKHSLPTQPQGVVVIKITDTTQTVSKTASSTSVAKQSVSVDWTTANTGIAINNFPGLDPARSYNLDVLIF